MIRRQQRAESRTAQFIALVARIMLILHAIAAVVVVGFAFYATVFVAAVSKDGGDTARTGSFSLMMAGLWIVGVTLSAVPWAITLLLCEIATNVARIEITTSQASGSAVRFYATATQSLAQIEERGFDQCDRLEQILLAPGRPAATQGSLSHTVQRTPDA